MQIRCNIGKPSKNPPMIFRFVLRYSLFVFFILHLLFLKQLSNAPTPPYCWILYWDYGASIYEVTHEIVEVHRQLLYVLPLPLKDQNIFFQPKNFSAQPKKHQQQEASRPNVAFPIPHQKIFFRLFST